MEENLQFKVLLYKIDILILCNILYLASYIYAFIKSLVGFIRMSDDLGGVTNEEHNDDATQESGHGVVPPMAGREWVVGLTVSV